MKGRLLLGCFVLSSYLLIAWQTTLKQTVLAESKEAVSSQPETTHEMMSHPTVVSSVKEEVDESAVSSINTVSSTNKETKSSESNESTDSVKAIEEESVIEETTASSSTVPETVNQVQPPLPAEMVEENYQFSVSKNQTTEAFIQSIGNDAQQIAWQEGLYASVMIAQAILETGSGNSQLARPPYHNLFGIKGSYQGKNVSFKTQEDPGNGTLYTIQAVFRRYPSYKESLEDYAALLKTGLSGNPSFYQGTWKLHALTYQDATKTLTGKYATDTSYDKKLNMLIETYGLTVYDQEVVEKAEESTVTEQLNGNQSEVDTTLEESSELDTGNKVLTAETKQSVVKVPSITQRPAKQVSGNQIVE